MSLRTRLARGRWPEVLRRFPDPPVIIGGCGRSGTTLLASVLSCHPRFAVIGPETRAFATGAYPVDAPPRPAPFALATIAEHLEDAPATATRWCEKSPRNVHSFSRLVDLFGGRVHLLHIVRDGRDVVCSYHPDDPRHPWIAPERWIEDTRAGLAQAHLPQVHTVRYEDLVADFEPTMRAVAAALEEPDATPFLRYPQGATLMEHAAWSDKARPVSATSVGRWRGRALVGYAQALERHPEAKGLLEACGFTSETRPAFDPPASAPRPWTASLEELRRPPAISRAVRYGTRSLALRHRPRPAALIEDALRNLTFERPSESDERGVFVVGPRYGGVEVLANLLAAHPELRVLPADTAIPRRVGAAAIPQAYLRIRETLQIPKLVRWVDPSPENLGAARLLRAAFPRARFLVCTRPWSELVDSLRFRLGSHCSAAHRGKVSCAWAEEVARWPQSMLIAEPHLRKAPRQMLERVLRFLNLAWHEDMDLAIEVARPHFDRLRAAEVNP